MFATVPAYNTTNNQESRIIRTDHIEQVAPHVDVPVDPGAVATPCCELLFHSGNTLIVLLPFSEMQTRLQSVTGLIDEFGQPAPEPQV